MARYGVRGGSELAAAFRDLARVPTAANRRAAREAALEPVKAAAAATLEANGSVITGALRESLAIGTDGRDRNRTVLGQRLGKVRGYVPSATAHLVEFSVRPHWQPFRFGGIMHPGHPGYPFMRPALDETAQEAGQVYIQRMVALVENAARSARKAPRR